MKFCDSDFMSFIRLALIIVGLAWLFWVMLAFLIWLGRQVGV